MPVRRGRLALIVAVVATLLSAFALSLSAAATASTPSPSYPPGGGPSISLNQSTVSACGQVTVFGKGFTPGTVQLTLHTAASSLGTANANASGAFTQTVTLASCVSGAHQICGTNSAGTACANIAITASGSGSGAGGTGNGGGGVSNTGVAVLGIGGLGLVLLLGGGLMLMAGRRSKATA